MLTTSKSALIDYALSLRDSSNNRAFTVGASDIGQCSRKVWFAKHGAERDPGRVDTWGATLHGQISNSISGRRRCAPVSGPA